MMTFFHFPTKLNLLTQPYLRIPLLLTGDETNLSSQLLQNIHSTRMSALPPSLLRKKDPCLENFMN